MNFFIKSILSISLLSLILISTVAEQPIKELQTSKLDYVLKYILLASQKKNHADNDNEDQIAIPVIKTFIDYYEAGISAYLENNWSNCAYQLESAVNGYREYYLGVASCRVVCEHERERNVPFFDDDPEHFHFYEGIIKKALCLKKCINEALPDLPKYFHFSSQMKFIFESRKPYEYLQLCYFKSDELDKAVAATYTVLNIRPDDKLATLNMKYYSTLPEYSTDMLIDQEAQRFVKFYLDGIDAYEKEDWQTAIDLLEKSLEVYIENDDYCRAYCEDSFDQGWFPDFVSSTANHFTYCLRCKQNCTKELSIVGSKRYHDVFPSHYEYLQYAYFKVNNLEMASRCTSSYLLFFPNNDVMLSNKDYYKGQPGVEESFFVPRNEAKKLFQRIRYEIKLLRFIDVEFYKLVRPDDTSETVTMDDNSATDNEI